MRKPGGYVTIVDPDAPLAEYDTASCGHCQRILLTKPGSAATTYLLPVYPVTRETVGHYHEVPGAFCRICMRPICLPCYDRSLTASIPCVVWERRLEASERRARLRQVASE